MKMKCPICGTTTKWKDNPYRPFCSERCKLIDLAAWADEEYKIEGKPVDTESINSEKTKI